MATGRRRKPAAPLAPSTNTVDKMASHELAAVLRALLKRHPELRAEAERIAIEMIAPPSVEDVADEVHDAVASLDIEELYDSAGKQTWGYVEPGEAASELLGEAVEGVLADMKRRADLGLHEAAEAICCGIVLGLHRADGASSDGPLGWDPDFPAEEARHAVAECIRASAAEDRVATRNRLVQALTALVPSWGEMVRRAADGAMGGQ